MAKRKRRHMVRTKNRESSLIVFYKFTIYLFLIAVLGTFFLKLATPLISNTANVLGISSFFAKGGDNGDSSGSGSGNSGDSRSSGDDSDLGGSSGNSGGSKVEEARLEVRISDDERIRARTKDGRMRIDITSDGVRTRLESRNDRLIIKAQQEDGEEVELEDNTIFKIEERLDRSEIKIATDGGGFSKRHFGARTHFPLSIDLSTNTLIVTTPAGTKAVAVLPDKAVQNMITKGIISKIGGHVIASPSGDLGDEGDDASGSGDTEFGTGIQENDEIGTNENIVLAEEGGSLVYKIKGSLKQKFLGVIPLDLERQITVSADTGEVTSVHESLFTRFLNLLSI